MASKASNGRRIRGVSSKAKGKISLALPPVGPNQRISVLWNNPKKKGSESYARYEGYKHAKTFADFRELGGWTADFKHDGARGYIHVHRHGHQPAPPCYGEASAAQSGADLDS